SGEIPVVRVWSKVPFAKERFLEAIQIRPTNRATIHHASVFRAQLPDGARIGKGEAWPGGPMVEGVPVMRNGAPVVWRTSAESIGKPLVFYVPAGGFLRFPRDVGKRIE